MKLKDIGTIVTGNTPSKRNNGYYESDDILFVKPSDIEENYITNIESSEEYISEKARGKARILPEGAVLVTCIGTIGKVGILSQEATCNQQINAIIPNDKVISKYLAYLIQSKQKILQLKANAPVVPIINKTDFSEIEINICDVNKQKEIVSKLDLLKTIIDKRKTQIEELQNIIKSQFVEMFGNIEKRVLLNNCCSKVTDYVASGSFASIKENVKYYDTKEYAIMVKTADFANDFSKNLTYTDKHGYDFLHNSNLFGGELLLSNIGASIGKVHRVPFINYPMTLAPNTIMLKSNDNYNDTYLQYYFVSEFGQTQLKSLTTATAMPKFNKTQLKELLIIDPPLELQNKFAKFVEQVDKQKFVLYQTIAYLEIMLYNIT